MRFQHRHHSMLAKVIKTDPDAIRAALRLHRRSCSVITGTEATRPKWGELLIENNWQAFHEAGDYGRGDPWVSWDPALWTLAANWTVQLSTVTYNGRRCHAAVAVLDHKGFGRRVAFISVHFPAHLEGDMRRNRATTRTRAYRSALAGLRDLVAHLRVEHPDIRIVLAADWNLNIRHTWVRGLLRYGLRTTGLTLVHPIPDKGSHGKRLIDWAATDLDSSGGVLPHISPFDHDPVAFTHKETNVATPKPYDLTIHDGDTVDQLTHAALLEAEKYLGYELTVVQGSYNAGGVAASGGTHDGGGVVDLTAYDWERKVRVLRAVGFAAWHRTEAQGPWSAHIHAVLIGNQKLAAGAASQVRDYLNNDNGLVGTAPDDGPRDFVKRRFIWPTDRPAKGAVNKARALLEDAFLRAVAKGNRRRWRALQAALNALPKG